MNLKEETFSTRIHKENTNEQYLTGKKDMEDKKAILSKAMCIYKKKRKKSHLKGSMKEFVKGFLQIAT